MLSWPLWSCLQHASLLGRGRGILKLQFLLFLSFSTRVFMMGEVLCGDCHFLTPNMECIQIGIFCLQIKKNMGILLLAFSLCSWVNTLEFRHWPSCYGTWLVHVQTLHPGAMSFCRRLLCGAGVKKQRTAVIPNLDLGFFPIPHSELTSRGGEGGHKLWLVPS